VLSSSAAFSAACPANDHAMATPQRPRPHAPTQSPEGEREGKI